MSVTEVLQAILSEVEAGRSIALCAIVATRGSTPQPAGTMIAVDQAAKITGTLGGGCVEADVRRQAHALLSESARSKLITFALDQDFGYDDGMLCGGQMDVAASVVTPAADPTLYRQALDSLHAGGSATLPVRVDTGQGRVEYQIRLEAAPELAIAGAGHIGRVLAAIAANLGFRVHVVDDRADYANADRFPPPIRPVVGHIAKTLASWEASAATYVVIVTRGHKHDEAALKAVLGRPFRYVGMIGSRRKIKAIFDDLRNEGATGEQLERVHAPIGLSINSVTVEEIAVSIAAELISVRRAERRRAVEGPVPVSDDTP